jgi:2-C-methyl-D-erythritol 4-phosphate cytidylyltransferase
LKKIAIIVAAGKGLRLGEPIPKQFLMLADYPVLYWSILRFSEAGCEVWVVLHPEMMQQWAQWSEQYKIPEHHVVEGGEERYHSVRNAIQMIPNEPALVAIHDAARPNLHKSQIEELMHHCQEVGSAIPYIIPADSIRLRAGKGSQVIDRNETMLIQTPQCFRLEELKKAYQEDFNPSFTDDASVMERRGIALHFVQGDKLNFKITHPSDWWMMQQIFKP